MPKRSRSSSRDRLLRLSRLRRSPSRPDAPRAAHPQRVLDSRRKRRRFAWILTPLVVIALLFLAGTLYVRQNFDVEKIVRTQVVPQLAKQLNAKVEIGSIDSDYVSRVTLHDIVIGRDAKLPLGALAQIKTATLSLDIPALALHRTDALGALRSIDLDSPRIVVQRDARGQLNWSKLWKPSPQTSSTQWTGTLTATNARIWYGDQTIRNRAGAALVADAQNIALKIDAHGSDPATFSINVPRAFVGHKPQQTALQNLVFDGRADPKGQWATARARIARVPVALLIEYSNSRLPVVGSGAIGGVFHVAYSATAPVAQRFLIAGNGAAREVGLQISPNARNLPVALANLQTRLSRINGSLSVQKINGPFTLGNRAFSTTGMTLQTLGSAWKINGAVAAPENAPLIFDVAAQTRGADATRLAQLVAFPGTTIRGGLSSGNIRVTGDAEHAKISGDVSVPNLSVQNVQMGNLQSQSVRAVFQTDSDARSGNVRFSIPVVAMQNARGDFARSRVLDGTATFTRNASNQTQINLDLNAPDYSVRQTTFGTAQGNTLRAQIAATLTPRNGRWNGQGNAVFRTTNLAAQTVRDGKTNAIRAASANGTLDFRNDAARTEAVLRFDSGGVALRSVSSSGTDSVNAANASGTVDFQSDAAQTNAALKFNLVRLALRSRTWGNGTASTARGTLVFDDLKPRAALSADVAFAGLQARPSATFWRNVTGKPNGALASEVRAQAFRVLVSTPDVRQTAPRWKGVSSFAGLNANGLNLTALSPDLARRVRNVGALSGQMQFAIDGKTASALSGDLTLSRAQIDQFSLRDISSRVIYRNGVLQLQNARAQSDEGPILLDAIYDVRRARGNLGLNTPLVQIEAARINPFLRASGVQLSGIARGQLRLATSLNRSAIGPIRVAFDMRVPRAQLRSIAANRVLETGSGAVLNADETRVQGSGVWQNGANGNWKFVGRAVLQSQSANVASTSVASTLRLGDFVLPSWTKGAQLSGLRLVSQGELRRDATQKTTFEPRLSGTLSAERAVVNLPSQNGTTRSLLSPTFVLQKVQATFSANGKRLQVARWQAQAPQLRGVSSRRNATPLLSGYLNVENGNLSGQVLARDLDAARVQRLADHLVASAGQAPPALRGVLFARAALSGTMQNPRALLQAHLYRGAVALPQTLVSSKSSTVKILSPSPIVIPLDAATLTMNLAPTTSSFQVQSLVLWSRGGRLAASGTISSNIEYSIRNAKAPHPLNLDLSLQLSNWRVRDLTQLLPSTAQNTMLATFDGALSGDLQLTGTTNAPRVAGKAGLRLASWNGVDIPQIEAQISAEQTARGPKLIVTNINGRVQGASVAGDATFDVARNFWSTRLNATGLPAERLVRLAESFVPTNANDSAPSSTRNPTPWRVAPVSSAAINPQIRAANEAANEAFKESGNEPPPSLAATRTSKTRNAKTSESATTDEESAGENGRIPLHGDLNLIFAASGDFGRDGKTAVLDANSFVPIVRQANAILVAESLYWRGREMGALTADVSLQNNVIRIADFSLLRQLSAREIAFNAIAQKNAGTDTKGDAKVPDNNADDVSQIRIGGTLPLDINAPDAAPFDTTVTVENERFTVFRDALQELSRVLTARGLYLANLDILQRRVNALPTDLEGRMNAKTHLTGHWGALAVGLDASVDNARTSTQTLPALQTSLVFANGAIDVNDFEIKQTFEENSDGDLAPSTDVAVDDELSSTGKANDKRRVRETALRVAPGGRIVPGGEISLDVEVLKANLAQLAGWLPELKMDSGKALLRGELSLFSFEVRGETESPEVTGSIEARDLSYSTYTLDRLRVAEFDIKNGMLSVEPGKLTVVKGGFQSSAASGNVPWSWGENGSMPGPQRSGALSVHLPLQTRDFGALAGAFVPALTNVAADGFTGSVDVTGSLDKPQIAGEINLKNARFRADPITGPFPFGVNDLSGTLRFADGNRVLVDHLSGQLARAEAVRGTSTGNRPAQERAAIAKNTAPIVQTNTNVALRAISQISDPTNATRQQNSEERPDVGGKFTLDGDVTLNFGGGNVSSAGSRLPFHHYNLDFSLRDGAFRSALLSGLRDISLDATWKTGEGAPQNAQTISWKMSAKGRPRLGDKAVKQTRGSLISVATVRLAPNFTNGLNAILHSRFEGDVKLKDLGWAVRDLGSGVLDGSLKLDNSAVIENAKRTPPRPDNNNARRVPASTSPRQPVLTAKEKVALNEVPDSAITRSSASMSDIINGVSRRGNATSSTGNDDFGVADDEPKTPAQNAKTTQSSALQSAIEAVQGDANSAAPDENSIVGGAPLRVSGALTISQTEITGVPVGGAGGIEILSPAPNFDVAIALGKDVRFTTPTLRAEVEGSLSVAGTPLSPRIMGVVSTRNGQIRFPNASARIEKATVEIEVTRDAVTRALRPRATIEATARGQVGRYAITIGLNGPLDLGNSNEQNLRVDVTSNPPLSQDEAFAQLTGTALRNLDTGNLLTGNEANQAYARAVVGLLSAPLFSGLERTLEQSLGLNSLTLDYRLNEPLGIEVGKAIGDRIFVTYRRSLVSGTTTSSTTIDQPSSSVRVDLRITGGVQLGVEADNLGRRRVTLEKTFRF